MSDTAEIEGKCKVTFLTNKESWHGHSSESLWAEDLGSDNYRLANVPFFAKGVSFGDVVQASPNSDGHLEFRAVTSRGGHSTCRVVTKIQSVVDPLVETLQHLHCECELGEFGDTTVLAVDIEPEANIDAIMDLLEEGHVRGEMDWEVGFDGHPEGNDEGPHV